MLVVPDFGEVEGEVEEEKCCWILSSRWRGLVGRAVLLASVTNVCLHETDLGLREGNCVLMSAFLAMLSLNIDREQCMQMVFIRRAASLMAGCAPLVHTEV